MPTWTIDTAHSNAEFSVRHMMISTVNGKFDVLEGKLEFDPANPEAASVEATVDVASINTSAEDRDNHLRSADFFDVENYPTLTFKSTKVEKTADGEGKVTGDLTMRGMTKEVTFDVEYFGEMPKTMFGDRRVGFVGTTKINREDWGLTWNQALETGGVLVSQNVKITVNLQAATAIEEGEAAAAEA
jgi:polyisoprenoid-binding protein YceI